MGENTAPPAAAGNGEVPGQPFYDKTRQHLKELLHKKRILERSLSSQEDSIFRKETEYLEETPSGNIITGFEAYTKGTGATGGGARRRGGVSEGSRVFSRSSISFNASAVSLP
jgi:chromatin modification-related protein EAF6